MAPRCAAGEARVSCAMWKLKCPSADQIRLLDKEEDALSFQSLGLVCFVFLLFLPSGCCCGKCMYSCWEVRLPGFPRTRLVGAGGGGAAAAWFLRQIRTPTCLPRRASTPEPALASVMTE